MSGGPFTSQNKILPGAYTNVFSKGSRALTAESDRGVVFTVVDGVNWGKPGVVEVTPASDFTAIFGQDIDSEALIGIKQVLLNAKKAYVFNMNSGKKATGASAVLPWKFTALHPGTIGNDVRVVVEPDPADFGSISVKTYLQGMKTDEQKVTKAEDLKPNAYVVPSLSEEEVDLEALATPVQVQLAGGTTDPAFLNTDELVNAIETYEFNTLVAPAFAVKNALHQVLATTAIRMRDEQGRKIQAVIPASESYDPDHEGVIVVENGVQMADGTVYGPEVMIGLVAGLSAAAPENKSLTYMQINGAVDVVPRFSEPKQIELIQAGRMVFISAREQVKILSDINSLHTFTDEKNQAFSKNRVLRVLDSISNNTRETWEDSFIGKVTNDGAGRDLFKANRAEYLAQLETQNAIQDFTPDDISVVKGESSDSVVANIAVQPTDAMEKLYMTVHVN